MMNKKALTQVSIIMWVALSISVPSAVADIYKVTKPDGQVVFTDNPPTTHSQEGYTIEPMSIPTYTSGSTGTTSPNVSPKNNAKSQSSQHTNYQVQITTPSEERAYRKPVQTVDVMVQVSPSLTTGDKVVMLVDGEQIATGTSASIATDLFNPGAHTLTVQVQREDGSTSGSDSMTFYVIQNTQAMRHKKQIQEQMVAYQNLPWHKKVLMQLQGKKPVFVAKPNTSDAFR